MAKVLEVDALNTADPNRLIVHQLLVINNLKAISLLEALKIHLPAKCQQTD